MASGEARASGTIKQLSWTDGVAQDTYYGEEHSFQYSRDINCDDELHGIKLSTRVVSTTDYKRCALTSLGEYGVLAIPLKDESSQQVGKETTIKRMVYKKTDGGYKWHEINSELGTTYTYQNRIIPGVVFQDKYWFGYNQTWSDKASAGHMSFINFKTTTGTTDQVEFIPIDHNDYTDESIEDPNDNAGQMIGSITAILNYNNTRLVVACGQEIWVYYPELDKSRYDDTVQRGTTGWKKVLTYEAGVTIVALTCTFEYLKVRAVDEGWNTKVYYYQGNNNLRSTFVYNVVDLTGVRVLHVYSINGVDYYTSAIGEENGDSLIDLNKMVGITPVKLFSQRAGMTVFDTNNKAAYFVGPTSISGAYNNGNIYIADSYGVFKFKYNPQGFDKGYMKWRINEKTTQVYGLCENKGFLYVSTQDGCYVMRLYDTGADGYQPDGVLISREYEGQYGGTITKMLDEIRMNFELNPMIDLENYGKDTEPYGEIELYVSPNNRWKSTEISDFTQTNGWYRVMRITKTSAGTRTEKTQLFNKLGEKNDSSFKFDWQTITYAIVIRRGAEEKATPIVRQIDISYHTKDKVNNIYNIN